LFPNALGVSVGWKRSGQGSADSGVNTGASGAVGAAAGAGAIAAGTAGVAAAVGSRPASGLPAGSSDARAPGKPKVSDRPVGIRDGLDAGVAASAGTVVVLPGRIAAEPGTGPGRVVVAAGSTFAAVWGRVIDAVAAGGVVTGAGAVAVVLPRADANVCTSWVAAAGFAASCCKNGRPGTPGAGAGAGAGAGCAAAEGLSASAAETAPAAAIMVVANNFPVRCMVSPIIGGTFGRPEPEASLLLELLK